MIHPSILLLLPAKNRPRLMDDVGTGNSGWTHFPTITFAIHLPLPDSIFSLPLPLCVCRGRRIGESKTILAQSKLSRPLLPTGSAILPVCVPLSLHIGHFCLFVCTAVRRSGLNTPSGMPWPIYIVLNRTSLGSAGGLYPAAAGRLAKQHGRIYCIRQGGYSTVRRDSVELEHRSQPSFESGV